jgi:hypothetical protein
MKIVSPSGRAPKARFASHFLQVYRPIDNEKLKSKANESAETLKLCGCLPTDGFSTPHLFREKHTASDKRACQEQG